jgi:hypothetical protein
VPPPKPHPNLTVCIACSDSYTNFFKPVGDFQTSSGEQAACLLDKADLLATFFSCKPDQLAHSAVGGDDFQHSCGDQFFEIVSAALVRCCDGTIMAKASSTGMGWAPAVVTQCTKAVSQTQKKLKHLQNHLNTMVQ